MLKRGVAKILAYILSAADELRIKKLRVREARIKDIKVGTKTISGGNNYWHLSGSSPYIRFEGTEADAKDISIRENAGKIEVYDEDATAVLLSLYPFYYTVGVRISADSAASDTWERAVFYAKEDVTVIDAGIVPDASFGQADNYAILEVQNKGTDGSGTTSLVSKNFDSAVSAYDYTSLGTISNASISEGEVLTFKKTVNNSGQIVPASLLVLVLERSA